MEFLKPVLGETLYQQVEQKLKGQKDIKLANLASGQYVDKRKFKAKMEALAKAQEKIRQLEQTVQHQQKRTVETELIAAAQGLLQKALESLETQQR